MKLLSLTVLMLIATPACAQSLPSPKSVEGVITVCRPVIDEEYRGDQTHRGVCVNASRSYLAYVYGPPSIEPDPNKATADLVYQLTLLYRPEECSQHETELPEAIRVASSFSTDPDQEKLILSIAQTIESCAEISTGEIPVTTPASPS